MKVFFRVDASTQIGSGHVMRCLTLAESLRNNGYQCNFVCREQKGALFDIIEARGFNTLRLGVVARPLTAETHSLYQSWLLVSEMQDAKDFLNVVPEANLVIVDHYGIGIRWESTIRNRLHSKIVAIDDLVRAHDADLIVDQTLFRQAADYKPKNVRARILAGTKFSILAANFSTLRKHRVSLAKKLPEHPKLLITMGGVDEPNASLKVLKALKSSVEVLPKVTILLSERAPHYQQVKSFVRENSTWVTHIDFVDDMASLMLEHDIAIGAPGSTSWERACLGLPCIVVPLAENQRTICTNLVKSGAALSIELPSLLEKFKSSYDRLIQDYEIMREASLGVCDGKGVQRLVKEISELHNARLRLRQAIKSDIKQVYDWQCEPETRRYALNKSVPTFEEHKAWMTRKLASQHDYFYIIEWLEDNVEAPLQVGVVRLDQTALLECTISIFIAPTHFGKGIARQALQEVDKLHPDMTVNATVLKDNKASQALFSRAGYTRVSQELFIRESLKEV
ncbi:UDP-2,4-diacetamido-2,4,6-trideoxy-beta-L-altropyranose hydrolase [Pseudoalteromonas maricaloris]|uniref:UDP-2,4-diacetamido-2,4, 6-trideoxy-beta-L-altropyranose hydrolase n=1 Tax=Pseudoalteromonas maricaloris TaxID=184924 RepID=UPI003C27B972